jgi:rhodanese-related sulfurtransferase
MSSINSISPDRLVRLIGTPRCPALVDVRPDEEFAVDPRLVPGSVRRVHDEAFDWAADFRGRSVVVVCPDGLRLSAGVTALLRDAGVSAETLEGGLAGWIKSGLPCVPTTKLPRRASRYVPFLRQMRKHGDAHSLRNFPRYRVGSADRNRF